MERLHGPVMIVATLADGTRRGKYSHSGTAYERALLVRELVEQHQPTRVQLRKVSAHGVTLEEHDVNVAELLRRHRLEVRVTARATEAA